MARRGNATGTLDMLSAGFEPGRPKGEQLREHLLDLVDRLEPGTLLPGEQALAKHFQVARMTVRQQVEELESRGRVVRIAGRGTFVTEPQLIQTEAMSSFSRDIRARGMKPGSRSVTVRRSAATARLAEQLEIDRGDQVVSISRIRTADEEPLALERTNLPSARFPGLADFDFSTNSLFDILETKYRVRPTSAEQTISAVLLGAREARQLEAMPGSPAFRIERLTRDNMGEVVEYGMSLYRGDRYTVQMHVGAQGGRSDGP